MTNTNHKIDDLWRTILGSDDDSRTNSDCDDEDDNWVSKEGADAISAAIKGDSFRTTCGHTTYRTNRDVALAVWERIAQGQFDYEARLFIQTVAQSIVKIEKATEDGGVTNENRTDYLADATGLLGTRDKYKKLREALAIYKLPSYTRESEDELKIKFLQSDEGVALLREAGKEIPSSLCKNTSPWSELLRAIKSSEARGSRRKK